MSAGPTTTRRKQRGIQHWMERVAAESKKARTGFAADPVHDLRVALRRCRSLADGIRAVDADKRWQQMRRAGKTVFQALGGLRDIQVMAEWVTKLGAEGDPVRARLAAHCAAREQELKIAAGVALDAFDLEQWLRWAPQLEQRAAAVEQEAAVFQVLALEKWQDAYQLHREALRNRSKAGFHALRIGIKRFRYLVENFLPEQHAAWGKDLKELQDALGEVHDLDVLLDTANDIHAFADERERERWHALLEKERGERLALYRAKMVGRDSRWRAWRDALPKTRQLQQGILKRFSTWAESLDQDAAHTRRVVRFALEIYDALHAAGLLRRTECAGVSARDLLQVAGVAHEVGREAGARGHHKRSRRLLEKLEPPPGWTAEHMRIVGLVARYHRGALPSTSHRGYRQMGARVRGLVDLLAGVLRLADALQTGGSIRRIEVDAGTPWITLRAAGYEPGVAAAEQVGAARHLLETSIGRPVMVAALI